MNGQRGLRERIAKIVDFTIADARLHDNLEDLSAESTEAILALIAAKRVPNDLSRTQRLRLAAAAAHPAGLSEWPSFSAYGRGAWARAHDGLVERGLMVRVSECAYEITEAGRALSSGEPPIGSAREPSEDGHPGITSNPEQNL